MFSSFFSWIRAKAREAVLAGLSDAAAEMDTPDTSASDAVLRLQSRLKALSAPAEEAPSNGHAKQRRLASKP